MHGISRSKTVFRTPATTSREIVYSCPPNHHATLSLIIFTNTDSTSRNIILEVYDLDLARYNTVFDKAVTTKDSMIFDNGEYVVLEPGDNVVLTASSADTVAVTLTVKEYLTPTRT
tara:strand:+ start:350 stop:697 length:348 start_codon:yes stop_codon:yes gene_type:complete